MNRNYITARSCLALMLLAAAPRLMAQAAPAAKDADSKATSVTPTSQASEEVILLDPFTVSAEEDKGSYRASSTLAGSRIRTDMKDVASSISVVTAEFLKNTGAKNNQDLLVYTANTEVGGVLGNYAGVGGTFIDGANESSNFLKPANNTRVRGLDSADNVRDYFPSDIPWDGYIVGRVDIQRGPNSILFGFGSPAGIINSSLNAATYKNGGNVENRIGSFGTVRWSLDYNRVLIPQELSVRIAALDDDTKYRQQPAYNHDKRIFGAVRWDPKFLSEGSAKTSVRANFEHGSVKANRPRVLPPQDRISPYFAANQIAKQLYDPYYTWQAGLIAYPSTNPTPTGINVPAGMGLVKNFWVVQYPGPGLQATSNPIFVYDSASSGAPASVRQASPNTYWGLGFKDQTANSDGSVVGGTIYRDGSIDGFPYGSNVGIAGFNEYAYNHWRTFGNTGQVKGQTYNGYVFTGEDERYPAADKGFYKNKVITDTSIFDFYRNLIDGPNKREWQDWDAYNIAVSQTFFNNRLGFEVVYDYQEYNDGQSRNLNSPYISVDIRKNLMVAPMEYPELMMANPNAGRAFVGAGTKNGGNSANITERENVRATVYGEFRADDFLGKNLLSSILGRHVVTGLYSKEVYEQETRNWVKFAADSSWADAIGSGTAGVGYSQYGGENMTGSGAGGLINGDVNGDWITYLSGNLATRSSAAGLNLSRITAIQSPHGSYAIPYYDSHWKGTADPRAAFLNTSRDLDKGGAITNQTDNVRNYVGWVTDSFNILNSDYGDIDRLYTDVSKVRKQTDSKGITLQSYLWDETIVGTWGYREDTQKLYSGASSAQGEVSKVARTNLDVSDSYDQSKGNSISWGLVVHTPKQLRKLLPWGSNISLTYSDGRNTRVENRYGFDGAALPNAKGRTKDIGVVISTLDDKLQFKATYYKTTVKDANLSSVSTETSTLGNNTYYLRNLEGWGTASAMLDLAGRAGGASGWEWYWNWALVDGGWDGKYNDPNGADFKNSASTVAQTAAINSWLNQMLPQSWYDAYGFSVNVTKAKAGDWRNAIGGWTPTSGVGGLQPSGAGRVNGAWPTGTADNESKGWEFEVMGTPVKGLNLSLNVSKVHAAQTSLGANLVNFVEAQYAKYMSPAGDLRLWWGGDATLRQYYDNNVWSAYQFQLQTNGKMMAEMAPWRANMIVNYNFDNSSRFKGVNVGLGYRWQDKRILGYALNEDEDNLDVNKPFWSGTEDYIDLWVGYERKLTDKIHWRVQLNVRNVGDSPHLSAISIQPNGQPGGYKIVEGMVWQLTNTFSF